MKSILMLMDSERTYGEAEINAALRAWNESVAPAVDSDHVTLRRLLVDYGHLERTADGGKYRVGFPARPIAFDLEVDDIDVRATIAAYRDYAAQRRQRRGGMVRRQLLRLGDLRAAVQRQQLARSGHELSLGRRNQQQLR